MGNRCWWWRLGSLLGVGVLLAGCDSSPSSSPPPLEKSEFKAGESGASFFLIPPRADQEWTRADAVSPDGLTVIGAAGQKTPAWDVFRWRFAGPDNGQVNWLHPPVQTGEPLGIVNATVSADGKTVIGDTFHPGAPAFFLWTEAGGATTEVLSVEHASPLDLRFGFSADGTAAFGGSLDQSFRWKAPSEMTSLGSVPGQLGAQATAISADGKVIAGNSLTQPNAMEASNDITQLFRWTEAGTMESLPLAPGAVSCRTDGWMSAAGDTIFATCFNGDSPRQTQIARWTTARGTETLKVFPANTLVAIVAISADGTTLVARAVPTTPPPQGTGGMSDAVLRWTASDGWRDLPRPTDTTTCIATDSHPHVGRDGSVLGNCSGPTGAVAAKWDGAGNVVRLLPPPHFSESLASSMSDDGLTIAGTARPGGPPPDQGSEQPTIPVLWWDDDPEAQPVTDFLQSSLGVQDLQGATLLTADVSLDGKTLWGKALDPQGRRVAWIARLL